MRGLQSLGINPDRYGILVVPVIMTKVVLDIRLIILRFILFFLQKSRRSKFFSNVSNRNWRLEKSVLQFLSDLEKKKVRKILILVQATVEVQER